MYKRLTDQQVRNLTRTIETGKEFVISHVGDGEYRMNVFGNIYSSFWQALKKAREIPENEDLAIYYGYSDGNNPEYKEYFIAKTTLDEYASYHIFPAIAHLTIEKINQKFDEGQ